MSDHRGGDRLREQCLQPNVASGEDVDIGRCA
jgi:hypothetical protein